MSEIVSAYQPHYLPRLHYLARARQADTFVIYDDVQFSRSSPHHRAPIEYQNMEWLTAPVRHTDTEVPIDEAALDLSDPWPARHLQTLVGKYGERAREFEPFYERLCPTIVESAFLREHPQEVAARIDAPDAGRLVEKWLQWDDTWRSRKTKADRLRDERNGCGRKISERKQADPDADIDDLVAEAELLKDRLADVEDASAEAKERRDRLLLDVSGSIDAGSGVDLAPMDRAWKLDGIDREEPVAEAKLVDLTVPLLEELFDRFEVTSEVVRSSELPVEHSGSPSEYLARLTEYLDGGCYLSGGTGYENYLERAPFDERGLDVIVQDWTPAWDEGNACALDVLFRADNPERYVR